MKRRDLERSLRQLGWNFVRHGHRHDLWSDGKRNESIPRHREVSDRLANDIIERARSKT